MPKRSLFALLAVAALLCSGGCAPDSPVVSEETKQSLIKRIDSETLRPIGRFYRCADMVSVVNQLRKLGKQRALEVLERWKEWGMEHPQNILLVCRCLFENPAGWRLPALGSPLPRETTDDGIKKYPVFPLAFSNRVPFFLISGYNYSGVPEYPDECLRQCQSLKLIATDLPTTGFVAAARSLVEEARFQELYPKEEARRQMLDMFLLQAGEVIVQNSLGADLTLKYKNDSAADRFTTMTLKKGDSFTFVYVERNAFPMLIRVEQPRRTNWRLEPKSSPYLFKGEEASGPDSIPLLLDRDGKKVANAY